MEKFGQLWRKGPAARASWNSISKKDGNHGQNPNPTSGSNQEKSMDLESEWNPLLMGTGTMSSSASESKDSEPATQQTSQQALIGNGNRATQQTQQTPVSAETQCATQQNTQPPTSDDSVLTMEKDLPPLTDVLEEFEKMDREKEGEGEGKKEGDDGEPKRPEGLSDLIQGGELWKLLRDRCLLTGSEAGAMMGVGRFCSRNKLFRFKKGLEMRKEPNKMQQEIMQRGHDYEPLARKFYEVGILPQIDFDAKCKYLLTKHTVKEGGFYRMWNKKTKSFLGYSPDGIARTRLYKNVWANAENVSHLLEIKVPWNVMYHEPHLEHYCQVQMGMLVVSAGSGIDEFTGHYVVLSPRGIDVQGRSKGPTDSRGGKRHACSSVDGEESEWADSEFEDEDGREPIVLRCWEMKRSELFAKLFMQEVGNFKKALDEDGKKTYHPERKSLAHMKYALREDMLNHTTLICSYTRGQFLDIMKLHGRTEHGKRNFY